MNDFFVVILAMCGVVAILGFMSIFTQFIADTKTKKKNKIPKKKKKR